MQARQYEKPKMVLIAQAKHPSLYRQACTTHRRRAKKRQ